MAASDGQAELDNMGDKHLEGDQELAAAACSGEEASIGDVVDSQPKFECPHCSKSYTTKKSLRRHLSSTDTACAKQRLTQEQASERQNKPRWACSRCGKDCATSHSVERHISNSCWRNCDECVADGVSRCDSVTKAGPCRTCEAKERSCTKHTSPVPGSKPQPLTGPVVHPQQKTPADEEAASTSDQKPEKRKTSGSPNTSPARAHKSKRKVTADHQVVDYGLGRVYDPLGGQAYVPPRAKNAAVSEWLQEQSSKSASVVPTQEQVQDHSPQLAQAGSIQHNHNSQQSDQFVEPLHVFDRALPVSATFLPSQHDDGRSTPNFHQHMPLPLPFRTYQTLNYGLTAPSRPSNLPHPPSFGGVPSLTAGRTVHLDRLFHQIEAARQQNQAHELDMARRSSTCNGVTLPSPFGSGASLTLDGQDLSQAQGSRNAVSFRPVVPAIPGQGDSVLTLQIHSNTHDKNGQPIYSILRIRRNETFGPRLNAYCANRGKEYGVHWMFVYRYQAATHENPGQEMQITLTWDMTPADVKDDDFPSVAMRNMDTIYVMKARPLASSEIKEESNEGGAVQSPGPQVSHTEVDITNGETQFCQNPDVTREWYQAVEQDAHRLRAAHASMKSTIIQQQKQLSAKDQEIAHQYRVIRELTDLSSQLRKRMQLPLPNPAIQALKQDPQALASHRVHQRPGPQPQQTKQQATQQLVQQPIHPRPQAPRTAFVAKCEAVRDPQGQPAQHLKPLKFPTFSTEFTVPDYAHQPNLNAAYNARVQHHGRFHDAADKVVAESGVDRMDEE